VGSNNILNVTVIQRIIPTSGSGPLRVTLDDGQDYYLKKSNRNELPFNDLISEVLANEFFKVWGVFVPEYVFATLNYDFFESQLTSMVKEMEAEVLLQNNNRFSVKLHFEKFRFNTPLFASLELAETSYVQPPNIYNYLGNESAKRTLETIAFLDHWLCNMDRHQKNLNMLSRAGSVFPIPIDHGQCLFNLKNLEELSPSIDSELELESLLNFYKPKMEGLQPAHKLVLTEDHLRHLIKQIRDNFEQIFESIPDGWGDVNKVKELIRNFLFDESRIDRVINNFLKMSIF
jgi:hypothetical protein